MRRLDVLEKLIDDEYDGSPSVFESRTGIKMAQVNQWFTGYRALRDKALKRIEDKTGKPMGWFDGNAMAPGSNLVATSSITGGGGATSGIRLPSELPEIGPAVETIAQAISRMSDQERAALTGKLASLVHAPDSPILKKSISDSLGAPAATVQEHVAANVPPKLKQLLGAKVKVSTSDFADPPPNVTTTHEHDPPA